MLYKSSRYGFASARALVLLTLGAAAMSACVGEEAAPAPTPLPEPVSASRPPPPISGGTLLVTADQATAVASDSDRDRVVIVDIAAKAVAGEIKFNLGDEPGRVVEGAPGRVYVALRNAGEVVSIDLAQKKIVKRTEVCAAPRGMAYDNGSLHVACATGDLVTMDTSNDSITRRLQVADDLRDIVVQGSDLIVTQFRSAQVLRIDSNGVVTETQTMNPGGQFNFGRKAAVAWKMVKAPMGGVAIVHQSGRTDPIEPDKGGYGQQGPCGEDGIVNSFVSVGNASKGSPIISGRSLRRGALPVDIAFSADGSKLAVVAAGGRAVFETPTSQYVTGKDDDCGPDDLQPFDKGQPVAVAFADSTRIVQTREPARLVLGDADVIELGGESMYDTGHALFHEAANASGTMACANCHPEGHEDGLVWNFANVGARRTQSIAGGILATAPFHWNGDLDGFDSLMNDVFTGRMAGPQLDAPKKLAVARWIDAIPAAKISPAINADAAARGKVLYDDAQVGCASCHSGVRLTNNQSVFVGTSGSLQVPSLRGISARAPFMHDGCANTLEERFTNVACGGGDQHGHTSQLSTAQIADLVAYLKTL